MQTEESSLQTKPENGEAGAKPTSWNEPIPNIAREKGIWLAAAANRGK
jgi:hypothetical protein